MADKTPNAEGAAAAAEKPAGGGGGIKAFIPLLANLVLMPVIAYLLVTMVLVPKLQSSMGGADSQKEAAPAKHEASAKGEGKSESGGKEEKKSEKKGEKKGESGKTKFVVPLSDKVLVNVAKTQLTRYLVVKISVVSYNAGIEDMVKEHDVELRNAAMGVLCQKTIQDLEQPQAMNTIRSELLSAFSGILGDGVIKEIYFTDFATE